MTKTNQQVTVTKRMLKEGLLRLLEQKPLEPVNITALCQEAGSKRSDIWLFWRVLLPDFRQRLITGTVLSFARGLGEYGATSMVSW